MRVGIILYGLQGSITGIGRYTVEIVRALRHVSNVEPVLIVAGAAGPLDELDLPRANLQWSGRAPALMTVGSFQIPLIVKKHALDIVHDPVGIAPFLMGAGGAKTLTTIHDVVPLAFPGVSTRFDSVVYRHWLPRITPRMDGIITVSEASKQDIMHHYRRPAEGVHVVYNAVDEAFQPAPADEIERVRAKYEIPADYILFVGSVEERKNIGRVLQAYSRIQHEIGRKLVIVGPKKWKFQQIEDTINELDLSENVFFTGYVDQADLPVIYSGADVFIYPSLYEGFGLPPLEAMSCGVPVITSNVSSLPEVVGSAGLTVDPLDVDALAVAMTNIVNDRALNQRLREDGLVRSREFSWDKSATQTASVYESLLESR